MGKKLVTFGLACALLLALVAPAMAQEEDPTTDPTAEATPAAATPVPITATTDLFVTSPFIVNVRSGPSTAHTILGRLTPADSLDITGQNADANWVRVNFNGMEGWVFTGVVDLNGDVESVPVVEPGPTAALIEAPDIEVSADESVEVVAMTRFNTNLRSSFSVASDVLEIIPFETELLPEARTENSNWVRVTVGDQSGWVFAPILFFARGDIATLPVIETSVDSEAAAQP